MIGRGEKRHLKTLSRRLTKYLFNFLPPFLFGEGLTDMSWHYFKDKVSGENDYHPLSEEVAGPEFTKMCFECFAYFALLLLIEYLGSRNVWPRLAGAVRSISFSKIQAQRRKREQSSLRVRLTSDPFAFTNPGLNVQEERDRVRENHESKAFVSEHPIIAHALTKTYRTRKRRRRCFRSDKAIAVDSMHLGVSKEGCFGLLGINGAGKTTTMRMICGKTLPSSGSIYVSGYDVVSQWSSARSRIGYCPQIDPLHEHMNAWEHLLFYGRLRGIEEFALKKMCKDLIIRVGLLPFAKKPSKTYSGGTKRKLSLAIALVGYPKVLLIDEASSGMDPQSKREMWEIIKEAAEISSVLFTSHSMEECEALCERIAILRKGKFACIGSKLELVNRYGDGLMLDLSLKKACDIEEWINENFPGAHLNEHFGKRYKYHLPKSGSGSKLSTVFKLLSDANSPVSSFVVSQPTLEHVFLAVAKEAEREEAEEAASNELDEMLLNR